MPVSSVNRLKASSYQEARPSALYTVSVVPSPEPEDPVPPQADGEDPDGHGGDRGKGGA